MNKDKAYSLFFDKGLYRIFILVFMCILLSIISDSFLSLSNIMNIFRQASILLILAAGATGTILAKGIDLSLAGVMSLSGCVCGFVLNMGYPVPVAILASVMVGVGFGFVNGFLVGVVRIPAFVSTYGVKYIANGLALMLMGSNIFFGFPDSFLSLGVGFIGPVPVLVLWALIITLLLYVFFQKSKFGRNVYCVGANAVASYYSGISTLGTYFIVHVISSTSASIAGVLQAARMNAAQAGMGESFQMLAVASIVIGGTSMAGGEGNVLGAILGALILTLITNGMNLMNISSQAQPLVTGAVIVFAVFLDTKMKSVEARKAGKLAIA